MDEPALLEDPRDPLAVERAVDGLSRFGADASPASPRLSPLAKRAKQVFGNADYQKIKLALGACGWAWCEGRSPGDLLREEAGSLAISGISPNSLAATFLDRCDEIVARVQAGQKLPLLSLPSDAGGEVAPGDLVDRLADYRAAGVSPGIVDLALALTRLRRDGRAAHLDRVDCTDEAGRAVAFALGAGEAALGDGPIWAAAWLARSGEPGQALPAWPSNPREPDAGIPARYVLIVEKMESDGHSWCDPGVWIEPELQKPNRQQPGSLLHLRQKTKWRIEGQVCGSVPADIAWSSLVRPGDPEAFLANAISALDTYQKLADHPCIAYLDAFDRLKGAPGPMGYAVLAYYLASEDKAVCAHVVDKASRLVERQDMDAAAFAAAIMPFMMVGIFPSMRWTRGLAQIAAAAPGNLGFVRDVLAGLMTFGPAQAPRDIGGMIELFYQLQLDSGKAFDDAGAIACLEKLDGGGKVGKFSGKLLALRG